MNANELRLGNWVIDGILASYPPQPKYTKVDTFNLTRYRDLNSIPLTSKILEASGFKKDVFWDDGSHSIDIGEEHKDSVLSIWFQDSEWCWSIHNNCYHDGVAGEAEVKYLHQLQNLYFALTGSELEINIS